MEQGVSQTSSYLDSAISAYNANATDVENDAQLEDLEGLDAFLKEKDDVSAFECWHSSVVYSEHNKNFSVHQWLNRQIAILDELICEQLNEILHHEQFQRLEASWLGLWMLSESSSVSDTVKIKLLDVSWRELSRDISRAADFDRSAIFHLVYNEEFGRAGGEPYGVLLGDYYVCHKTRDDYPYDDVFTLQGISAAAAAAFAPFICAAAPQLFGLDDYETLAQPMDLNEVFRQEEYIRWRSLREVEDSRFLGVTLPQVLMRRPYNRRFSEVGGLRFQELVEGSDSSKFLWGNPCFAMGLVLIREFLDVGWFSHIRGVPRGVYGGGLVTQFPPLPYETDSSPAKYQMLTPVLINDFLERDLSDQGLVALCHCYDAPFAAFQSCPSLQKPRDYNSKSANANARISAMLQQILCASRFAQYIKVMMRDKIGSFISQGECERYLQQWLEKYSNTRSDLDWDMMARYPLREARVKVVEEPGKPGSYQSVVYLKTHYTVDHLVSELKLTTSLGEVGFNKTQ